MSARFGPAGNSDSFSKVHKSSLAAPAWIAAQGLECYEYQCGKGVHVGEETARKLGYTRLGGNVTAAMEAGLRTAEEKGNIAPNDTGMYLLTESGTSRANEIIASFQM